MYYLLTEKKPIHCDECQFCVTNRGHRLECVALQKEVSEIEEADCPLKELPERMSTREMFKDLATERDYAYMRGYNNCLAQIIEEFFKAKGNR